MKTFKAIIAISAATDAAGSILSSLFGKIMK